MEITINKTFFRFRLSVECIWFV